ncbi:MAG: rRNA maturation RNase YbeY [Clostridiaceae bacterium]|nr:rRNA maturation RNase YbeY [Clostridiaceae bacterium]
MSINYFYDRTRFRLKNEERLKYFIKKVITIKQRKTGNLSFIFTSDKSLLKINQEFLGHDYFTDVISFDYGDNDIINGEVYISIDRVKKNSRKFETDLNIELTRVMLHGVLHLCGMNDIDPDERMQMRMEEEKFLKML